ncbi:hypothetical protein [Mesorhizobium sp. M0207]|uniref:hypothetical protein n=1 Tax=Mesorhizobium sp. M0207 TaxID=2956915 RepID=UPI00333B5D9F
MRVASSFWLNGKIAPLFRNSGLARSGWAADARNRNRDDLSSSILLTRPMALLAPLASSLFECSMRTNLESLKRIVEIAAGDALLQTDPQPTLGGLPRNDQSLSSRTTIGCCEHRNS